MSMDNSSANTGWWFIKIWLLFLLPLALFALGVYVENYL